MSTLAVVEGILRQAEVPMSVREIVERAGEALPTKSKTPDTVVARDLSMDIKKKGETSMFVRTSPGRYAVRDVHVSRMGAMSGGMAPSPVKPVQSTPTIVTNTMETNPRGPVTTDGESSTSN